MRSRTNKPRLAAVAGLMALAVSAIMPLATVAAPGPMRFQVTIGAACINGSVPDGTPQARVTWRDAALELKLDTTVEPDANGNWGACAANSSIETGDRIRVRVGSNSHLLVVPELTLNQSRVNDVYRGRGPAGDYVRLICGLVNGFEPCDQTWKIKVNSEGHWGYNPQWDVVGGDFMSLQWTSPVGDKVLRLNYAPFVVVTINRAGVSGSVGSDSDAVVMLKNATTLGIRGQAEVTGSSLDGQFASHFTREEGERVRAKVGNIVVSDISPDVEFAIENIQATPNVGTHRINGDCPTPTGLFVRVTTFRDGVAIDGGREWPEENGSFRFTSVEFQSGDKLLITCDLASGDRIQKWFAVP